LSKDRTERYQIIKGVLIDLKDVKQDLEFKNKLGREVAPRSLAILYAALGIGDEAFMQFEKPFVEATHTCLSSPLNRHTTICVQTRAFTIYCGG